MKTIFAVLIFCVFISCKGQNSMIDKSVVKTVDIEKYVGTWYEIARYDHKFERGLVGVTATYTLNTDGTIQVVNKGYKDSLTGKESIAIGKAKIPNSEIPAKLKVSFFWIFYADYYILELDNNYEWAIIGSKSDDYLWILHRKPQIESELHQKLISLIKARGYDTSKLITVQQTR
ncbi:MAG: Outer membrane lipoprotein Blc precursor [Bacteroidetes bacterium ADurb.Bin217]|nr:MAG: Outer membrane lipoprotein Blc precursor [Bacteroidetes bacterium ADurb.Bin217]